MLPYRDSRITKVVLIVFFLIVICYGYFEAQGLLFGPSINVTSSVTEVHDPLITVQGQTARISSLLMNGEPIQVTESGAFSAPYLLSPGYNRIVLEAKDGYGRTRSQVIEVVYTPTASSSEATLAATSTAPTSNATSTGIRGTLPFQIATSTQ